MARQEDGTGRRLWRVLGPIALILTGAGWLAIGLVWGRQAHVRSRVLHTGIPIERSSRTLALATTSKPYGRMMHRSAPRLDRWILNPASGNAYSAIDALTWDEAQATAAALDARLVAIDGPAEQAWLLSNFGGDEPFWIGLTDADHEGQWHWATGEPVAYTNWADGEPNNMSGGGEHFGVMNWLQEPGKWNDMSAKSAAAFNVRRALVERAWQPRVLLR